MLNNKILNLKGKTNKKIEKYRRLKRETRRNTMENERNSAVKKTVKNQFVAVTENFE